METGATTEPRELISISSSSSSSSPEDSVSDSDSEFYVEEISSSACDGDENDGDEGENVVKDEDSMSRRIVQLLRERSNVEDLSLLECKAYLRRHGLRLSGTRAECVLRIKEHWRVKDGRGEILYPRSSFTIDCTGDACMGDLVMFRQKVFKKSGGLLGKRTVAGWIVKESYGAAKQQHTFTVEVVWSKGVKELPPLFPLLVKGRKLYRMKTFRQKWNNERDRIEVLSEKHKRGAEARQSREMRRTRGVDRKNKRSSTSEGRSVTKRQKQSLHSSVAESSRRTSSKQQSHHDGQGKEPMRKQRSKTSHLDRQGKEPMRKQRSKTSHLDRQGKEPMMIQRSNTSHQDRQPFRPLNSREKGKYSPPASQSWHQNYNPPAYQQRFNPAQSHRYHQERPYSSNTTPYSIPSSACQGDVHNNTHPGYGYPAYPPQRNGNYFLEPGVPFLPFPYASRY